MRFLPAFRLHHPNDRYPRRGLALVEIMISSGILLIISVAVLASLMFSSRATRLNTHAMMAKNIAQGYFERMNSDAFADVREPLSGESDPDYPDVAYDSDPPVFLDEANDIRCEVDIEIKGFGIATGGSDTSLEDSSGDWLTDEWVGSIVYIVDGPGVTSYATIDSNTNDTLTLSSALSTAPVSGQTKYMINNGKTVRITTRWEYMGKAYEQTIGSLIINYRNDDLGF